MLRTRRRHDDSDRGMTVIELVVAMGIFSAVLAVAGVGIRQMIIGVNRTADIGDSATELQRVFQRFDRTLRYAERLSVVTTTGSNWSFWYRTPASAALGVSTATCYQWQYVASSQALQLRSWPAGGTTPAYGTVGSRITRATADTYAKDTTYISARVVLSLTSAERGAGTDLNTTFVARNAVRDVLEPGSTCS